MLRLPPTIQELHKSYTRHHLTPMEVTRFILDQGAASHPSLNAFLQFTAERALQEARRAETKLREGSQEPFLGVPYHVKDMFDVRGLVTTGASEAGLDRPPAQEDAAVVRALSPRGGILMGKTHLLEFAYGETHPRFGFTRNPWNPSHSTGGSTTGGAAAVAAGLGYVAIGTDTGGSIRLPASYCGLVGLKPTYGVLPTEGMTFLSPSLDHIGFLTRSAADMARVWDAVRPRHKPITPDLGSLPSLRVAVLEEAWSGVAPEVEALLPEALAILRDLHGQVVGEVSLSLESRIPPLLAILAAEASWVHRENFQRAPGLYSQGLQKRLKAGSQIPAVSYLQALEEKRRFALELRDVFKDRGVDLLLLPTSPTGAHSLEEEVPDRDFTPYVLRTGPFNLAGTPALSLRAGFTAGGLPLGLQWVAPWGREDLLLRLAYAYERATPGVQARKPPGALF
ncbi:MAG: amidase [Bacillota bacterium]|nr:amidase [Bacillota bacterium]